MEGKSPKRTREVGNDVGDKRLRAGSGAAVLAEVHHNSLPTPAPAPAADVSAGTDSIPTVRKAFSRLADSKAKLLASTLDSTPFSAHRTFSTALAAVPSSLPVKAERSDLSELYAAERKRQRGLQEMADEYETRLKTLEESLRATQSHTQSKVAEKKLAIEELEARKSAALEQRKRDNDRLKSVLENYRRLTGIEVTTADDGSMRCRLKLQQKELIFRLREVDAEELEVMVVSYTVPAEKIPNELKEEIVIDKRDAPKLLHLLLSCLL